MAHPLVVPPGRVQSWKRRTIKEHIFSSVWDQLSNRAHYTYTVPKSAERKIPTTVVHKVSDAFNEGTYQTTCLWVGRPQFNPIAGPNKAEGRERKLLTRTKTIRYNVQRFPMALNDRSVGGDITRFYKLAEKTADVIRDLFVESTDYDHERALCEGCDEWLSESQYWQDSEYGSEIDAPCVLVLHPNMYVETVAAKIVWSATYATAETNLQAGVDDLAATDNFGLGSLDRIHLIASRTINPLGGYGGNNEVKWILKLSDAQWYDLVNDVAAGSFRDLLKYTDKGFNMFVHGHVGVYKNMLIMVSQRNPVYNLAATAGSRFQYVKASGDERVRAITSGAGTADGSAEIAALLGMGAIALAEIEEMDFVRKGFDYDFSQGMTGTRSRGTERMDLDVDASLIGANRFNESSFLYFTATSAATIP